MKDNRLIKWVISIVAGFVLLFFVEKSIIPAVGDTDAVEWIFFFLYVVLTFLLLRKPIQSKIPGGFGLVAAIVCAVILSLFTSDFTFEPLESKLWIVDGLFYSIVIHAVAARLDSRE